MKSVQIINQKINLKKISGGFLFLFFCIRGFCQPGGDQEFLKAIEANDLKQVKELVRKGADVNMAIPTNSIDYQFRISRFDCGTQPEKTEPSQPVYITPIAAAARQHNLEVVKFLMKKRGNADAADSQGKTPLMYALAQSGGEKVALYMLKRGANYVVEDYAGNNALHYAAYGGNSGGISMALGGGLNVNQKNHEGITPFLAAANHASPEILKLLQSLGALPGLTDSSGMNAVFYAAAGNKPDNIQLLVSDFLLKADTINSEGYSALDLAAYKNRTDVYSILHEHNSVYYHYLYSELIAAIKANDLLKVIELVNKGVNVDRIEPESPMHLAAGNGFVGITEVILKKVKVKNMADKNGKTAFQVAIASGQYRMASVLFREGVSPKQGDLPLLISRLTSDKPPVDMDGYYELLEKTFVTGADLQSTYGPDNNTPLHFAVLAGDVRIVQMLLDQHVDVNALNKNEWTPLLCACLTKDDTISFSIISKLLASQATSTALTGQNYSLGKPESIYFPKGCSAIDIIHISGFILTQTSDLLLSAGTKPALNANGFFDAGIHNKMIDHKERAEWAFRQALLSDPKLEEALFEHAKILGELERYKESINAYSAYLKLKTDNPEAWAGRGERRFNVNDYAGAKDDFSQAIKLNPENAAFLYYRGQTWLKLVKKENACSDFKTGMELGDSKCTNSFSIHCK